jgi:hypothetical protein
MRMSLSFPLLISAVPLHEPATRSPRPKPESQAAPATETENSVSKSMEALATGGEEKEREITAFRICWFSDGGISSNFPIHLFDAPLPLWAHLCHRSLYPKAMTATTLLQWQGRRKKQSNEASVFLPPRTIKGGSAPINRSRAPPRQGSWRASFLESSRPCRMARTFFNRARRGTANRIVHISLSGVEGA